MMDDIVDKLMAERNIAVRNLEDALKCKEGLTQGDGHAMAEYLHKRLCKSDHRSMCMWWIAEWDMNPRKQYLQRAEEFIALSMKYSVTPSLVFELVDILIKPIE